MANDNTNRPYAHLEADADGIPANRLTEKVYELFGSYGAIKTVETMEKVVAATKARGLVTKFGFSATMAAMEQARARQQ